MPIRVNLRRLENEVIAIESQPVQTDKVLFYGDSIFTRWKTSWGVEPLESVIVGKNGGQVALNHGIGSSTAEETLYYYSRLVKPYKPSALIYKIFGNDWLFGYGATEIFDLASRVLEYTRCDFPGIQLFIHDVGLHVRKVDNLDNWICIRDEFNSLVYDYVKKHDDCQLLSPVSSPLFFENPADAGHYSKVRKDMFIEDGVHFNQKGYALFAQYIKSACADVL